MSGLKNAVNITRAVSRLKSVFITHYADLSEIYAGAVNRLETHVYKTFNTFDHPSFAVNTGTRTDDCE